MRPDLARRIDRLSRVAHRFHRYAHHPLCPAYRHEVLHLGRRWVVCKGCTWVVLGLALGMVAACLIPARPPVLDGALMGLWLLNLVWLSSGRRPKWAARAVPALLAGFLGLGGLLAGPGPGWIRAGLVALLVALVIRRYRKQGPHRGPCGECPERSVPVVCTGFQPMLRRERAFQRLVRGWLS